MRNGELVNRKWLLYSPSQGSVYCFVCRLFSSTDSAFSTTGFNDWKHASSRIHEHEHAPEHERCNVILWKRQKETGRIDSALAEQLKHGQTYWQDVLKRVVAVVKFMSSRGLAFRGENQIIGSQHNGNYLGILELISQFDPFLDEHIKKYGNAGKGNPSYLSANICEEFITLISKKVFSAIISELREAKYYSLSVDSTPDVCHIDQLTFTVRYVKDDAPKERFLEFLPIHGHGAEYLADVVVQFLKGAGIPISDCRGQSYDNASNMAGQYSGLQARIKEINKFAVYVPCAGHSLNLVGVKAAECNMQVVSYFDFVQHLYTFFSASTHRWNVLVSSVGRAHKIVKRLSDTRWSAHADAVNALCDGYERIQAALDSLSSDNTQTKDTAHNALSLLKKMEKLETIFLTIVWNDILLRFNETSKTVQKEDINLSVAVNIIQSLKLYVQEIRDKFNEYEVKAKAKAPEADYSDQGKRVKQRSSRLTGFEGAASDTVLQGRQKFHIETYLPIMDSIINGLTRRGDAYKDISNRFGFLVNLRDMDGKEMSEHCIKLASYYHQDLEKSNLISECQQFKHYTFEKKETMSLSCIYKIINNDKLGPAFPNLEIALRIFLSMMVTNCSGERSFSKLKLIKSELRNRMLQARLNSLALLSIESERHN
ncbi:zinc finger MYM-type protein 1-like [Ambystoma mexicanum]|uniref:zinc finger MYM-type protein 1-like n=1 Tax=Ambystoma mexicanum TaxID=8296 RepID=UPI0037E95FBE